MPTRPKAILFDLCDTLYLFDSQRLPTIRINGREIRSTAGLVHQMLSTHTSISLESFYSALMETTQEIVQSREQDHHEVTSEERFRLVLNRLGLGPDRIASPLLMQIVLTHMNALATALHLPSAHRELVKRIKRHYPIGMITNFDHSPTVHRLLQREGLEGCFEPVVISADVGWRKPKREIFQRALDSLRLAPQEVLFVGNDLKIDVHGAQEARIPVAWFNRHHETPTTLSPAPDYVLADLQELDQIL